MSLSSEGLCFSAKGAGALVSVLTVTGRRGYSQTLRKFEGCGGSRRTVREDLWVFLVFQRKHGKATPEDDFWKVAELSM